MYELLSPVDRDSRRVHVGVNVYQLVKSIDALRATAGRCREHHITYVHSSGKTTSVKYCNCLYITAYP